MHRSNFPILLLVAAVTLVATASGLICYQCRTANMNEFWMFPPHPECSSGSLPQNSSFVANCSSFGTPIINPFTNEVLSPIEAAAARQSPYMSCLKVHSTSGNQDFTIKGCSAFYNNGKDKCEKRTGNGQSGTVCACHSDRCNSGTELKGSIMAASIISLLGILGKFGL